MVVREASEHLHAACCKCLLPGMTVLGMALPALYAVVLKPWTSSMALVLGPLFYWRWVGWTNVAQHNADAMTCVLLSRTCADVGQGLAGKS